MFNRIVVVLFVGFVFIEPANAYIDPGTGSMLFSALLCSITTLFFLFNSIVIFCKRKIFSSKSLGANKDNFVIYSEGNQYYSLFKPILDEFEARKIPVMYYTSAKDDYLFDDNYNFVKVQYIGKGNKAYFKLAFLNADVCLMTVPQLDVLQLKRSKHVKHYSHIFHSIGFSMCYRLFSVDYYDSVLCDAEYQIPMIRQIEKRRNLPPKELVAVGCPYMDFNKNRINEFKKNDNIYTVLIAPSWGQYSLLNRFGSQILEQLKDTGYRIIVRPHPQSRVVDEKLLASLKEKYKNFENILWDFSNDNLKAMAEADILISDFSGILTDYAFLFKRPLLYIDTDINYDIYDCCDMDDPQPWRNKVMNVIGRKLNIDNGDLMNLKEIINEVNQNKDLKANIEKYCNEAWAFQGSAAKNVVDFLVNKQKEVADK